MVAPYRHLSLVFVFIGGQKRNICERVFHDAVVTSVRLPVPTETLTAVKNMVKIEIPYVLKNLFGQFIRHASSPFFCTALRGNG
jgi:hypothetical protein